jgi:hypothetical protein
MENNIKNFMTNLGILCETWTIVYRSFVTQGLSHADAIVHTKEFMSVLVTNIKTGG